MKNLENLQGIMPDLIFPSVTSRPILMRLRAAFDRLGLPLNHAAYEDWVMQKYNMTSLAGLNEGIEREQTEMLGKAERNAVAKSNLRAMIERLTRKV